VRRLDELALTREAVDGVYVPAGASAAMSSSRSSEAGGATTFFVSTPGRTDAVSMIEKAALLLVASNHLHEGRLGRSPALQEAPLVVSVLVKLVGSRCRSTRFSAATAIGARVPLGVPAQLMQEANHARSCSWSSRLVAGLGRAAAVLVSLSYRCAVVRGFDEGDLIRCRRAPLRARPCCAGTTAQARSVVASSAEPVQTLVSRIHACSRPSSRRSKPYFERSGTLRDVAALAAASEDEVTSRGRASAITRGAQPPQVGTLVVERHGGVLPATDEALAHARIGPYTASAVAAIGLRAYFRARRQRRARHGPPGGRRRWIAVPATASRCAPAASASGRDARGDFNHAVRSWGRPCGTPRAKALLYAARCPVECPRPRDWLRPRSCPCVSPNRRQ